MPATVDYSTFADFVTGLTSSSGEVYKVLHGSEPGAIVARITETGESYACGLNVMMDIKSVGPGDYVVYEPSTGKLYGVAQKWIDNNYPSQPTYQTHVVNETLLVSAGFTIGGTCAKRFGNRIRLAGEGSGLPWSSADTSDYDWDVEALVDYTTIRKKGGITTDFNTNNWCAFPSQRYQEDYFTANRNTAYLPCTRAEWNAAIVAMTGTSPASTITINNIAVNPADYDYNYDKFIAYHYKPLWPSKDGAYADSDGRTNTRHIVTEFVASHGKSVTSVDYAAGYCYNYSVNVPGLGAHQWFLGTLKDIGELRPLTHTLRPGARADWRSGYYWSSTQFSRYNAWYVVNDGDASYYYKCTSCTAVPLADLILED